MNRLMVWPVLFALISSCSSPYGDLKYQRISRNYEVNQAISPCSDFYEYSCSKVESNFKLPANRSLYVFAFSDSKESILAFKKNYLKQLFKIIPKSSTEQSLKDFYSACMDEKAMKKDESSVINEIRSDLNKITTKEQMLNYLSEKIQTSYTGLISFETVRNQEDSFYNDLILFPHLMSLPEKTYYKKPEVKKEFEKVVSFFFESIGEKESGVATKFIVEFESELAQIFPDPEQLRDIFSSKTKISKKELIKLKNLRLSKFLANVPDTTLIRNIAPAALRFMDRKLATLSLDQLKYLYIYQNLKDVLDESRPDYFRLKFSFEHTYLGGPLERPDRQERCTSLIMDSFPMELDSILLPRIFPEFPREKFVQLAEKIRQGLLDTLAENTWLSPQGKAGAIKKMKNAELLLVSPRNELEWNFRPKALYSPSNPVRNLHLLNDLLLKHELAELGQRIPKERWQVGPLEVNAYYDPSFNHFVMPVAILQEPFFDPDQSWEQNLAAIGTVIGHELGHGIDDKGRLYDDQGRLRSWVSKRDVAELNKLTLPLVNQFNQIGHNGRLTLGENIGDLVGLSTSFQAAFPEYSPGKYNKDKLQEFYLQYARVWCEVQTPSMVEIRLKTNPHSLGVARVNEQIKHQKAFKEAFTCKQGDPMVLDEKKIIKVW